MKRFLFGAALLCVFCSAAAQSAIEHYSSMVIGDVVPDVTIMPRSVSSRTLR